MNIKKINTIRIDFSDGFYCDITTEKEKSEFWMYNRLYGVAEYMFGVEKINDDKQIEIAINNSSAAIESLKQKIEE